MDFLALERGVRGAFALGVITVGGSIGGGVEVFSDSAEGAKEEVGDCASDGLTFNSGNVAPTETRRRRLAAGASEEPSCTSSADCGELDSDARRTDMVAIVCECSCERVDVHHVASGPNGHFSKISRFMIFLDFLSFSRHRIRSRLAVRSLSLFNYLSRIDMSNTNMYHDFSLFRHIMSSSASNIETKSKSSSDKLYASASGRGKLVLKGGIDKKKKKQKEGDQPKALSAEELLDQRSKLKGDKFCK
jgi:hypothetical protein